MADGSGAGTVADDYSSSYYNDAHLGGYGDYGWENAHWRGFFEMVADRLIGAVDPSSVLDVGCAKGMLVQALRARKVDAVGFDISDHAISSAHPDVRPHLRVASATAPIEGRFDLITCVEVLEHVSPQDAQLAIDRMTEASDRILFTSSPADHAEPTHINTKPTATWAAWFAERGFYRRTDVDVSFLTTWAVLFEREDLTPRSVVQRYEAQYATLNAELVEKRAALLDSYRASGLAGDGAAGSGEPAGLVATWEAEVLKARRDSLTLQDHFVGTEAELSRLRAELQAANQRIIDAAAALRDKDARMAIQRERVKKLRHQLRRARAKAQDKAQGKAEPVEDSPATTMERLTRGLRGGRP